MPPSRKKARSSRSGVLASSPYRKTGRSSSPASRLATASASSWAVLAILGAQVDDRHDVERADAGMDAAVGADVDPRDRLPRPGDERVGQRLRRSDEREDAAPVVRIGVDVQQPAAVGEGPPDRVQRLLVLSFADVRDRLERCAGDVDHSSDYGAKIPWVAKMRSSESALTPFWPESSTRNRNDCTTVPLPSCA